MTIDDFKEAFAADVRDQVFKISIEDIIKPLKGKMDAYNKHPNQLFDDYDMNKNGKLSANELAEAIRNDFNFILEDDEIRTLHEFF